MAPGGARSRNGFLVLVAAVALIAAACADGDERDCGEVAVEAATSAVAAGGDDGPTFRILWLGDTLLADAAEPRLRGRVGGRATVP